MHLDKIGALNIATTQAKEGAIKGALQTARMITTPLPKIMALAHIAGEQARLGDTAGAETNFKQALQDADVIKENGPYKMEKGMALQEIVKARTASGDIGAALQVAGRIESEYNKSSALTEIATIQVQRGDLKGALQTAEQIKGDRGILRIIAVEQAKTGDIKGALQIVNAITFDIPKTVALAGIATAQAQAGDIQGSLLTIKSINGEDSNSWKASTLAQVAKAEAKANDRTAATKTFQEAIQAAKAIGTGRLAFLTATKLAEIGEIQAKAGDKPGASTTLEEAVQAADAMPNPPPQEPVAYSKPMAFSSIAMAQAESDDIQGALRTANSMEVFAKFEPAGETYREWPGGSPKIAVLRRIANSQGKGGKADRALVWINQLTSPLEQTQALMGLAEGLLDQDGPRH